MSPRPAWNPVNLELPVMKIREIAAALPLASAMLIIRSEPHPGWSRPSLCPSSIHVYNQLSEASSPLDKLSALKTHCSAWKQTEFCMIRSSDGLSTVCQPVPNRRLWAIRPHSCINKFSTVAQEPSLCWFRTGGALDLELCSALHSQIFLPG